MADETDDLDKRRSVHEAVCAERHAALLARMGRLQRIIPAVAGTLITGMGGLLVKLLALVAQMGPA